MAEVFENVNEEKHDVGIFGLWYGLNYGSQMTYFALKNVISSMGYTVALIRNPLGEADFDFNNAPAYHPYQFASRNGYKVTSLRRLHEMNELNQMFDKFVIGSDQMWNYYLSKPYLQSYFLDFAGDDKIKVAYATSFGHDTYDGPESEKTITKNNLERFSAISVRDTFSKELLNQEFFVQAEEVIDPVFLCDKAKYDELLGGHTVEPIEEEFIFAYILDPNSQMGETLSYIANMTGLKIVVVSDLGRINEKWWEALKTKSDRIVFMNAVTAETWLNYINKAKFVLTDSFHGAAFSIIYHKPFIVKKNSNRGGKRFDCLLDMAGLKKQMVTTSKGMLNKFELFGVDYKIDYEVVEARLALERERCYKWLSDALAPKKINTNSVEIQLEKSMCTGCTACKSTCPVEAINMQQDVFGYYRAKVDHTKCVNCGKCVETCPSIKLPAKDNSDDPELYEFVASDANLLKRSSSGGVFTLVAEQILKNGGCVAGAAWGDNLKVEHILIETEEELDKLRKSKYMQSYVGNTFTKVKKMLQAGRPVLFSGTPCQVAGLKKYLGRNYDSLFLVDILCGNSPSVEFFRKYLDSEFPEGVAKYEFRSKDKGWNCECIKVILEDGDEIVRNGQRKDYYQKVFHSHIMCPHHCEKCKYQEVPRFGDITIGDFWGIGKKDTSIDTKLGVSAVLANNEKGKKLIESIETSSVSVMKQVPKEWLGGNGFAFNNHNWSAPQRDLFYKAILKMPFKEAAMYAMKPNHGVYRSIYDNTHTILQYDSKTLHFKGESDIWEEHTIDGRPTYIMKKKDVAPGHYLALALAKCLELDTNYRLCARFRIKTSSDIINLHLKDSGSKNIQIIHTCDLNGKNDGKHWIEVNVPFTPDAFYYDEFMIGARQVIGDFNFIEFDYVMIREDEA